MPITITARRDGFRRCGRAHPARPTTYPDNFWTSEQIAALKAEPMLIVKVAAADEAAPAEAKAKKAKPQ